MLRVLVTLPISLLPLKETPEIDAAATARPEPPFTPVQEPDDDGIVVPVQAGDMRVFWRDTLRFETVDKQFTARIGGRIQADWTFVGGDDDVEAAGINTEDTAEIRRARLDVGGTVYERFGYHGGFEFAGGDVDFRWLYLSMLDQFGGDILLGQFKEPFGLEELTSPNDLTFLERALPRALNPVYSTGIMYSGAAIEERLTYQLAFVRSEIDEAGNSVGDGNFAGTARVTYAMEDLVDEGDGLVHFGAAYSVRSVDGYEISSGPEASTVGSWVSTGTIADAENVDLLGLELAGVLGPFSLQGEYTMADVDSASTGDPSLEGWYAQASYFLTGESRPYRAGRFRRVRPTSNWRGIGDGTGAVEVAVRVSNLDLGEAAVGEELDNLAVGLNWYLNPNVRFLANVIQSDVDFADSDTTIFGFRTQIVF